MTDEILEGIKVVEYCCSAAGSYCSKLLGGLGAEVVKIEIPKKGDPTRYKAPFWHDFPGSENSGLFFFLNVNKLSMTLDPTKPSGREIFDRLLKDCDILIEDGTPSFMRQHSLDYKSLAATNSRLVVTSITPFGQTGPYSEYKAYPLNSFHSGGEGYLCPPGSKSLDRPPTQLTSYFGEFYCGLSAAGATLLALLYQTVTGEGQHVDISKQQVLMINETDLLRWPNEGLLVNRATRGFRFLGGILACKDGYVDFSYNRFPQDWLAFLDVLGNPEWSRDERMKDRAYIIEHGPELTEKINSLVKERTKQDLYQDAINKHCPLGPCFRVDELLDSAQLAAMHFFIEIEHPRWGKFKFPTSPYRLSETSRPVRRLAPGLGEHNEQIYLGRLHLTREDLVKLTQAEVI